MFVTTRCKYIDQTRPSVKTISGSECDLGPGLTPGSCSRCPLTHLLEVDQEGALVLPPAVPLHSLLHQFVEDGGD